MRSALDVSGAAWTWSQRSVARQARPRHRSPRPPGVTGLPQIQGIARGLGRCPSCSRWTARCGRWTTPRSAAAGLVSPGGHPDVGLPRPERPDVYANGNAEGIAPGANTCSLSGRARRRLGSRQLPRRRATTSRWPTSSPPSAVLPGAPRAHRDRGDDTAADGEERRHGVDAGPGEPGLPAGRRHRPPGASWYRAPGAVDVASCPRGCVGAGAQERRHGVGLGNNNSGQAAAPSTQRATPQQAPGLGGVREP